MVIRFLFVALTALFFSHIPAHADDFLFTTTGQGGGVVNGEIEGLQNNMSSIPTDVIIFSQPSGYTYPAEDLLANGYQFYNNDDMFTETNGVITAASAGIYKLIGVNGDFQGYGFNVSDAGFTNANGIYQTVGGTATASLNFNGFAGTTYTPVPEPRQEALLVLVAGAVLLGARKMRFWNIRFRTTS